MTSVSFFRWFSQVLKSYDYAYRYVRIYLLQKSKASSAREPLLNSKKQLRTSLLSKNRHQTMINDSFKNDGRQQDSTDDMMNDTFEMVPVDLKRDSVASSLPAAEEVRASLYPPSRDHRKRNRWALGIGIFLTIFIIILVVALTASNSKSNSSGAVRNTDFESVVEFLANEGISDREDLVAEGSPQNRAALWLAEEDPRNVALPTDSRYETQGYLYVARYVMALNYFAMGGQSWPFQLNFLSGDDICRWNVADWGIFCSPEEGRRDIPVRLYIGKFASICY